MPESRDFPNVVGNEGFLFSEGNGHLSREEGVLGASQDVKPGAFAARLTSNGQLVRHVPGASTGAQTVIGLFTHYGKTAAGETKKVAYVARDAEVNKDLLDYGTLDANQKTAALAALTTLGIRARATIREGQN